MVPNLTRLYAHVEPLFRRIEALRMNLAKHELPNTERHTALAPGTVESILLTGFGLGDRLLNSLIRFLVTRRIEPTGLRS